MIDTWTALTLAINTLRDTAESRRMPSGIALDPNGIALHLDAAECLETLRDATLDNPHD